MKCSLLVLLLENENKQAIRTNLERTFFRQRANLAFKFSDLFVQS